MNESVMHWVMEVLPDPKGKRVLEVGSLDVNGGIRGYVEGLGPSEYLGIDIKAGIGVDRILDARDLTSSLGARRWDVVISTEMLEHCREWQEAMYEMKESLDIGGSLMVTTRSPGFFYHEFPGDYWRFTKEILDEAMGDLDSVMVIDDPNLGQPGVFAIGVRVGEVTKPTVAARHLTPFELGSVDPTDVEEFRRLNPDLDWTEEGSKWFIRKKP